MTSTAPVLITGGAGFLGAHVVQAFARAGRPVRVLDLAPPPQPRTGVEWLQGSVCDADLVARAVQGTESVVHAAFASPRQDPKAMRRVNVDGTRQLFEAAARAGARRFVLISSTIVDKPPRRHPFLAASGLSRLDDYRTSRLAAERWLLAQRGPSVAAVRPKTFLGPGKVGAFAMIFDAIRRGEAVPLLGPGDNRYPLLDVRDMAAGIVLLEASDAPGVFPFGATHYGSVAEDLSALCAHAGTGARLVRVPAPLACLALRAIELAGLVPLSEWHVFSAERRDGVVDIRRAQEELGWRPAHSNVQALTEAYDAYVEALAMRGRVETTHPLPATHRLLRRLFRAMAG